MSTSAQNGAIKNLPGIGNGSGVKVGTGAVNDITPLVLIYVNIEKMLCYVYFKLMLSNITLHTRYSIIVVIHMYWGIIKFYNIKLNIGTIFASTEYKCDQA